MEFTEPWPLHDTCSEVGLAARNGNFKELKRLICQNRPVDVADDCGWRPLHEASALAKNLKCMEELLKHEKTDVNWQTNEGETALWLACSNRRGDVLQAAQLLICRGADINIADNEGETPLLAVTRSGLTEVAFALLNTHEANTNRGDIRGWTPLHEAVKSGQQELVRALLAAGAQLDVEEYDWRMTPLCSAAQYGSLECLNILLEATKERGQLYLVNSGAHDGATPLITAAEEGFMNCVKLLLSYDANPNIHTKYHLTALHLAVQGKHREMLQFLLQVMDVNILKDKCMPFTEVQPTPEMCNPLHLALNPLHLAVEWKSHECLELLLQAGFSVDTIYTRFELKNEDRLTVPLPHLETPLSLALNKTDIESAKILLKHGANVNACASHVLPPLYSAILNGTPQHIDFLLKNGTDISACDALLVAVVKPENLCHLLRRGANPKPHLSSGSALLNAIFQVQKQDQILTVVRIILAFLGRDSKTINFISEATTRSRSMFQNAHDVKSWNELLETMRTPLSLLCICRSELYFHLCNNHRTYFIDKIASLRLPVSLFSFMNHEDVLPL